VDEAHGVISSGAPELLVGIWIVVAFGLFIAAIVAFGMRRR
jgi:hypothetical protein